MKRLRQLDDDLWTDLTEREEEVLGYIEDCIAEGSLPTRAEMAKHFGWRSANAAQEHIDALIAKGRLEPVNGRSRYFKLRTPDEDARPE